MLLALRAAPVDTAESRPSTSRADRRFLPVIPLSSSVLFPGPTVTITLRGSSAMGAVDVATSTEGLLFAVAQRAGAESDENPRDQRLYSMGTVARVAQVQRGLSGVELLITGVERAVALSYTSVEGSLRAATRSVESVKPADTDAPQFAALYQEARDRSIEFGMRMGLPEDVLRNVLGSVHDAGELSDFVATYLDLPLPEKQALLETLDVEQRLHKVLVQLQKLIELNKAQEDIQSQVREELGERQREVYLREQLKQIHKELGDKNGDSELSELSDRLARLELPAGARREAERELSRLESAGAGGLEAQMIRGYLQWIVDLPWNVRSADNLDLERAQQILEEDHFGLADVKDRVLEFLAVRQLKAQQVLDPATPAVDGEEKSRAVARGPLLLFLGPPGVGKTSIAQSVARALGREYVRLALGGVRDEAEIRGHRRTYVGAMPGRILQGLKQAGSKNPVFLLDEIDKLGISFQGDPASALLEVLDPAQNHTFTDHYLGIPFDLSEVLFIATANVTHTIPPPLLDRMESVEFSGYTEREKAQIAERYLVPRQLEDAGLSGIETAPVFREDAIATLVSRYTRESGVRQLERRISAVLRKLARRLAAGETLPGEIDSDVVYELLGRPRVHPEHAAERDEVGLATGMYYSQTGGDIMFVEAAVRPLSAPATLDPQEPTQVANAPSTWGDASLVLTGQLGEVMQESARAALTYATTHAEALGMHPRLLGPMAVHVHVPAGAVPKDGPSAGTTIATALVSALTGRPVRSDVALTGEISLRGRVLPIGGVKEKVLGAHRAGIRHILLPAQNRDDLADLPTEITNELEFDFVEDLSEVFRITLRPA